MEIQTAASKFVTTLLGFLWVRHTVPQSVLLYCRAHGEWPVDSNRCFGQLQLGLAGLNFVLCLTKCYDTLLIHRL